MFKKLTDIDWDTWQAKEKATLLFVIRDGQILLIHKKRGLGHGKINGPGGRLEPGETPLEAAIREVQEEVGMTIPKTALHAVGEITFRFPFMEAFNHFVHVFVATAWEGDPIETDEMLPNWFPVNAIPFNRMWQDDIYWLPIVLEGKTLSAEFEFGEDNETVVQWTMQGSATD